MATDWDLAGYSLFNALHIDGLLIDRVRWCDASNTRATADGSVGDPYASIQDALDDLEAEGITDGQVRLVMIYGGIYEENLDIPGKGVIELCALGPVELGTIAQPRNLVRIADSNNQVAGVTPRLRINGAGRSYSGDAGFTVTGQMQFADIGAVEQSQRLDLRSITAADLPGLATGIVATFQDGTITISAIDSTIIGITAPNGLLFSERCNYSAAIDLDEVQLAFSSQFSDITVDDATDVLPLTSDLRGFYDCAIFGDFTGPAGSLLCDPVTASIFNASGGSLLGGATIAQIPIDCGTF